MATPPPSPLTLPAVSAGRVWTSAEQYYQAQKFPEDEAYRERIRATRSGHDCWKLGNTYEQLPEQQPWGSTWAPHQLHHEAALASLSAERRHGPTA